MAFGFPAQEFQYLPETQLSKNANLYLAFRVCKELRWTIEALDHQSLTATTLNYSGSWNETFIFTVNSGEVALQSFSNGNQIYDQGRNKKNIDLFINAYNFLKKGFIETQPDEEYLEKSVRAQAEIAQNTPKEPIEISSFYNFFSLFIPTQSYFTTPLLIWANILVWLIMSLMGANGFTADVSDLIDWGGNISHLTIESGWWRLLTAMFLHGGLIHLVSNCVGLAIAGLYLESLLKKWGFLFFYLLTGIIASCSSLFWYENIVCVGASGAIFGMFGFLITALLFKSIQRKFQINSVISILVFVGINLLGSFGKGIDSAAHIGGFSSGILLGVFFHLLRSFPVVNYTVSAVATLIISASLIGTVLKNRQYEYQLQEYWGAMNEFSSMEKRAIDGYYYPYGNNRTAFAKQLKDISLYYWEENIKLIEQLDRLNLPKSVHDLNKSCKTYCNLHMEMVDYMIKDLNAGGGIYKEKIQELNSRIKIQVEQLKTQIEAVKKTENKSIQNND